MTDATGSVALVTGLRRALLWAPARRDLQAELLRAGCRVRVYVPFGPSWYPYFMRRLAERPANLAFLLRSVRLEAQ